jgi:hypothetical protein
MNFSLIVLAATLLVGMLAGGTLSDQLLAARTRRQAADQRSLNCQRQEILSQWQEIEAARQEIAHRREGEPGAAGQALTPVAGLLPGAARSTGQQRPRSVSRR